MDPVQTGIIIAIALAVVAFIVWPMLDRKRGAGADAGKVDLDRVEQRIQEYRAALRRRTVCETCLYANADGSRFCADCGARLPAAAGTPAPTGPSATERS